MNKLTLLIVCLLFVSKVQAQDFHFSQFYSGPLNLNPALTGSSELTRMGINYRKQWPGLDFDFNGYSAFIDHYSFDLQSGIGLVVNSYNEQNMSLNTTEIGALYAYNLKLSNFASLRMGTQITYARRSGNLENLIYGDQIDVFNRTVNSNSIDMLEQLDPFGYLDLGVGVLYANPDFWIGISGHHLNNPRMLNSTSSEFEFLPIKYGIQAGWEKELGSAGYWSNDRERYFSLMANLKKQGVFSQLDLSAQTKYDSFIFGLGFRGLMTASSELKNYESLIGIFGVSLQNGLILGYSYDWMISAVGANTKGSHEFSLRYQFLAGNQKRRGQRDRILKCFDYKF
uniref:PorP/SprF family type IX secretion system membrane protein n=1 Tax=Algoriphagus sp. TaxID=1872435 RepID=UPI004047248F